MTKDINNFDYSQLIVLFMKSLDLKVNDMVNFLEVSANTIYNYRTMNNEHLPSKVTSKLYELLDVDNADDARNLLSHLNYERKNNLLGKLGKSISSKTILNSDSHNNIYKTDTGLEKLGSKVFTDALFYEMQNVVNGKNDYEFIAYIKKYKKGE